MYKRLLVISHNCFSMENSNGRTLAGLMSGWPKDKIAQFYIYDQIPNSDVCNNYFRVTDKQALMSIFQGSVNGKVNLISKKDEGKITESRRKYRNSLFMLIRDFVWNIGCWKGKYFYDWVKEINPEIILVQAGDAKFILRIATNIAKNKQIPLVVYNSEGYYFKKYDYFKSNGLFTWIYPIFIRSLRNQIRKTYEYASFIIYSNKYLQEDFAKVLYKSSVVIYTASDITPAISNPVEFENLKLSYLGNLGLNRHETLIELATVIQSINPNLKLDVYGKCPTNEVSDAFAKCDAINYKGFISYQEVKEVIAKSDILFHVESFSDFYVEDIKYGFSTKIADSLMSGICFFLYAPESLACTKYMADYVPECTASNKRQLTEKLSSLINNSSLRMQSSQKCLEVAKKNHSSDVVVNQFLKVIESVIS